MGNLENLELIREILEKVKNVEDKEISDINPNWYYYATSYNSVRDILQNGIKCSYDLTGKKIKSASGPYYVSVCKNLQKYKDSDLSAYDMKATPGASFTFILDESLPAIKAINMHNNELVHLVSTLFMNTSMPIRFSNYKDEYQVLKNIEPKYFVGILICIAKEIENEIKRINRSAYSEQADKANSFNSLSNIVYTINFLKDLIVFLDNKNIDLPLYDFSYNKEINKRKIMVLEMPVLDKKKQAPYLPNYNEYI